MQPTKIPTSLQAPPSLKSAPAPKLTPPPSWAQLSTAPKPHPCLPGAGTTGASWTGGTLLLPEAFGKEAVGQERSGLSWGGFLCHEGSKKARPLWACPGYLPGIAAAGGRRQVMFTRLRPELPKGFNQAFESAPGPEPQNNNQNSLPDPQVAGASGFFSPCSSVC